jgi:hypothetical protein
MPAPAEEEHDVVIPGGAEPALAPA